MKEIISRGKFLKRLAGLLLVAAGYGPKQIDCPIYMFHMPSANTVESVVYGNLKSGRLPITVSRLASILLGEEDTPEEPLFCMTFDDGYLSQYQLAVPVLRKWSVPATFFVMGTGWHGDGVHAYMSPGQIQELAQDFEIGSHTINHPPSLTVLRGQDLGAYLAEIVGSKTQLEELLQMPVLTFAYPTGVYDLDIIADVQAAGYRSAVSTGDFRVQRIESLYSLGRSRR